MGEHWPTCSCTIQDWCFEPNWENSGCNCPDSLKWTVLEEKGTICLLSLTWLDEQLGIDNLSSIGSRIVALKGVFMNEIFWTSSLGIEIKEIPSGYLVFFLHLLSMSSLGVQVLIWGAS